MHFGVWAFDVVGCCYFVVSFGVGAFMGLESRSSGFELAASENSTFFFFFFFLVLIVVWF